MKSLRALLIIIVLWNINYYPGYSQQSRSIPGHQSSLETLYNRAIDLASSNPDSAYIYFQKCEENYRLNLDSTRQVQCLLALSDLQKSIGNYSRSYDYLWEALLIAENSKNEQQLFLIHNELGILYGIFEKEDNALIHKETALKFTKNLIAQKLVSPNTLLSCYFSIALSYRKMEKYELAISYFDSCLMVENSISHGESENGFIDAELGYIKMKQGYYFKAEELITNSIKVFESSDDHYLVLAYSYLGELNEKQHLYNEAITNLNSSLLFIDRFNAHNDLRPYILEHLSKLYFSQNNFQKAYEYLGETKIITDSLFNIKGNSNQLFEIKNGYLEALELKNEQIQAQELLLIQKTEVNLRLKVIFSFILLVIAIIAFLIYSYVQKKKYLNEKRETELNVKHESEKAKEVLDVKNKELTAYTLQLIDKDRVVNELVQYIQTNFPDSKDIQKVKRSIIGNNQALWDEFNIRFVSVNADFYARLRTKFPTLTPTQEKHCALIRLKFSSKDMAQLLRISVESVHISRHRLRKKMSLSRDTNLSNFIAEIGSVE